MSSYDHWNYRVLRDGDVYFIGEVYYDTEGTPETYCDVDLRDCEGRLEDLVTTVKLLAFAVDRPYLQIVGDRRLVECVLPSVAG